MATKKTKKKYTGPKKDVYQTVTDQIVAALEEGVAPWTKSWATSGSFGGSPRNAVTGRPYNGINQLVLWCSNYPQPLWLTFKQAKDLGGSVNKGEKGTTIVFWKFTKKEDETTGKEVTIPFARAYTVFNVAQTSVDPARYAKHLPPAPAEPGGESNERRPECDAFIEATGARIHHGGDRAFYSPLEDHVGMPNFEVFNTGDDYYSVCFHELTHWTGARERCKRQFGERFGTDAYAFEELVAELGAAFLSADFGLQAQLQHAEYIGSWIKRLKKDNRAIFTAASKARQAVDFLHEKAGREVAETGKEAA